MYHNTKKYGNHVYIRGAVETSWNGSSATTIAILPEGFRPQNTIYFFRPTQGNRLTRIFLNVYGQISIEWVLNLKEGTNATRYILV